MNIIGLAVFAIFLAISLFIISSGGASEAMVALQPVADWLTANGDFISKRTGLVEGFAGLIAIAFTWYGLRLAKERTIEMRRSNDNAENNIRISQDGLEATQQSLEATKNAHLHDQEVELHKQFREAASSLEPKNFARARFALLELVRLSSLNPKVFSATALEIIHDFMQVSVTDNQMRSAAAAVKAIGRISNTTLPERGGLANQHFLTVENIVFYDPIVSETLAGITFRGCRFLSTASLTDFTAATFEGCRFKGTLQQFSFCKFDLCEFRWIGQLHQSDGLRIAFQSCSFSEAGFVAVHHKKGPITQEHELLFGDCNLNGLHTTATFNVATSGGWHFGDFPCSGHFGKYHDLDVELVDGRHKKALAKAQLVGEIYTDEAREDLFFGYNE